MSVTHEFFLPNVDFGLGDSRTIIGQPAGTAQPFVLDKIEFSAGGFAWTLRKLYRHEKQCLAADELNDRVLKGEQIDGPPKQCPHSLLQATASEVERVEEVADQICWLLNLALAQSVAWTKRDEVVGGVRSFKRARSVRIASFPNANRPLANDGNRCLKSYLEGAYPGFMKDADWWRVTLDWYTESRASSILQLRGLMSSIILERAANRILKGQPLPEQIATGLDKKLTDEAGALLAKFDEFLKRELTPGWQTHRSSALLQVIKGWNKSQPFKAKVQNSFGQLGLTPPDSTILAPRDTLAHKGEIELDDDEFAQYHSEISYAATAILMKMLDYQGPIK